ncbi:Holliday junction branch migration protein RuvA [Candidatus Azambacteria bacterium]|nr:Holliday junction branch migration protein RuvA [Candidatus Azambacteria bacterium]
MQQFNKFKGTKGFLSIMLLTDHVGYKVFVTERSLSVLEHSSQAELFTHLNVKEDALELYGFQTREELELFELLITISGIGPRVALGVVSIDTPDAISEAILNDDAKYMTKVSGIGLKTAQKIVIELRDKVAKLSFGKASTGGVKDSEVIDALEALGYSSKDAREALKHISKDIEKIEGKIKEALIFLGK